MRKIQHIEKKTVPAKTKAQENETACDIYRVIQKERSVSWELFELPDLSPLDPCLWDG